MECYRLLAFFTRARIVLGGAESKRGHGRVAHEIGISTTELYQVLKAGARHPGEAAARLGRLRREFERAEGRRAADAERAFLGARCRYLEIDGELVRRAWAKEQRRSIALGRALRKRQGEVERLHRDLKAAARPARRGRAETVAAPVLPLFLEGAA